MIQKEWGYKHLCQNCGSLFYDMQGDKPVDERSINCASCGKPHNPYSALKLMPKQQIQETEVDDKEATDFNVEEDELVPEDTADLTTNDEMEDIAPEEKEGDEV